MMPFALALSALAGPDVAHLAAGYHSVGAAVAGTLARPAEVHRLAHTVYLRAEDALLARLARFDPARDAEGWPAPRTARELEEIVGRLAGMRSPRAVRPLVAALAIEYITHPASKRLNDIRSVQAFILEFNNPASRALVQYGRAIVPVLVDEMILRADEPPGGDVVPYLYGVVQDGRHIKAALDEVVRRMKASPTDRDMVRRCKWIVHGLMANDLGHHEIYKFRASFPPPWWNDYPPFPAPAWSQYKEK